MLLRVWQVLPMNLQKAQDRINELMSIFVAQVKGSTAMGRTDINRVSETMLIPLFSEIFGIKKLRNLNFVESSNFPGIDIADDSARVAFQITSTATSEKVKDTLQTFVKHQLFKRYDKLMIYILTEKQKTYAERSLKQIAGNYFSFEPKRDILDYRNLLKKIAPFQINKVLRIQDILEANFANGAMPLFVQSDESVRMRSFIPQSLETEISMKSRRRCCLCVYLLGDKRVKRLQLAHIDHNRANNSPENLAPLCLEHHDEYDTKWSQSKGITTQELKSYNKTLFADIDNGVLRFDDTATEHIKKAPSDSLKVLPFDQTQYDVIDRLSKSYLERLDVSERVQRFLSGPGGCLVITGEPGGGKSTFAANLILSKTRADGNVAFHFIESTRRGWKRIIAALLYQLEEKYSKYSPHLEQSMEIADESFEDEYIIQNYRMALSTINKIMKSKNQSLLIVIDALDELISSPLDLSVKNLFEFIPSAPYFHHIHFIVTTRLGDVYDQFKNHMGANLDEFDIGHFGSSEISELCFLYRINLSHGDSEKLLSVSGGNPLYLSVIFKEIMKDKTFDIGSLPRNIVYFFRSDLINKYNIEADTLLREFLAVILILREQLSDVALSVCAQIT